MVDRLRDPQNANALVIIAIGVAVIVAGVGILASLVGVDHRYGTAALIVGILVVGLGLILLVGGPASNKPQDPNQRVSGSARSDQQSGGMTVGAQHIGTQANYFAPVGDRAIDDSLPQAPSSADGEQKSQDQQALPKFPIKEKSPRELMTRIATFKPLERKVIFNTTYVGRWVRWTGSITHISVGRYFGAGEGGYTVQVREKDEFPYCAQLELSPDQKYIVEDLEEGEQIRYEGKITQAFVTDVYLSDVTISREILNSEYSPTKSD